MDTKRQIGVKKAFVDLFKKGDIYRGEKMLHYCPTLQSVISDIEVDWLVIMHFFLIYSRKYQNDKKLNFHQEMK